MSSSHSGVDAGPWQVADQRWAHRRTDAGSTGQPLHRSVVSLARADAQMYELLALIDGLRVGEARVRKLAARLLSEWILAAPGARAA